EQRFDELPRLRSYTSTNPLTRRARMRKSILSLSVMIAIACGPRDPDVANRFCPVLPQLEGLCFGITFDSLKAVRPGAFRDSDGIREIAADSTQIIYYFSGASGIASETLVGVRLELAWDDSSQGSREAL